MAVPKDVLWDRDPHTAAKHQILTRYLAAWFPIIAATFQKDGLTYVDAFAGPGKYRNSQESSPVIALTQANRRDVIKYGIEQRLLFIEKDANRFKHLKEVITTRFYPVPKITVECRNGECLSEMIPTLQAMGVVDGPIFVNFDGWGVDTPASLVRFVGRMKSAEVLVTFQTAWFIRFVEQENQPAGDKVFGTTSWRGVVRTGSPAVKKKGLIDSYRSLLAAAGFPLQLDFELLDEGGHELLLFFGTSKPEGLLKMKEAMWDVDRVQGRRFRDPKDINQLAFEIENQPDLTGLKEVLVSYVETRGERTLQELKEYALYFTIYLPPQVSRAIAELAEEGRVERVPGRGHQNVIVRMAPPTLFRL